MFARLAGNENDYYGRTLPNLILSPDPPKQDDSSAKAYADAVNVYDPYTKKVTASKGDWSKFIKGVDIDAEMKAKAAVCAAAKSPQELANVVNYNDKVRCGWIIKPGPKGSPNPTVSQGAIGTSKGPLSFFPHEEGTWYWNLLDAQKVLDTTRCACLTNCRDVGAADFYGQCSFCKSLGRGVPVKADGSLKYPNDPLQGCGGANNLVSEPGSCPPPPAPGSPAAAAAAADICSMDANGQVSRDCLLNRLLASGCSDQGSLAVALQTGATPNNYAQALETVPAFMKYQKFATTPLNSEVLRQGKGSGQVALAEFQRLATDSRTANEETAIGASARDLCVKKGTFDNYDFCNELSDSSRAPFALECLQKEFRRQGGQPAGALYPIDTSQGNPLKAELDSVNSQLQYLYGLGLGPGSGNATFDRLYAQQKDLSTQVNAGNTFNYWNTNFNTWGEVKAAMKDLAAATKSTSKDTQSVALKQLLGIQREKPALAQIDPKNGFEIFFFPYPGWGQDDKLTLLGRRVLGSEDFPTIPDWSTGPKFQTGIQDMHFAIITNLRPNADENNVAFQVSTDDGTALSVNTDIDPIRRNVSEANYFSRFFDQAPTFYQNVCTQLVAGGPNYVTIRYYNGGGAAAFKLQFKNCSTGEVKPIPPYMFTLTQEPAAPYAAFEVINRNDALAFEELRFGRGMLGATTGGTGRTEVLQSGQTLPGGLIPYRVSAGASWTVKARVAFQALRTISFAWVLEGGNGTVFSWVDRVSGNGLVVSVNGQQMNVSWKVGGITSLQGSLPVPVPSGTQLYTRITFEAVGGVSLPNQIRIATIKMSVNDVSILDNPTNQVVLVAQNSVLFSRYIRDQNMAGFLGFGVAAGDGASGQSGAGIQVGFLHIFDYVLDTAHTQNDVSGTWQRKFIY